MDRCERTKVIKSLKANHNSVQKDDDIVPDVKELR